MAKVGAFRFWCQKVLPLVYDDSISYYELLNKMVVYLNNVISDFNTVAENFDNLDDAFDTLQGSYNDTKNAMLSAYDRLQSYVNNYFDNLDVQKEINNKLDEMAEDGSLSALLEPFITAQISSDVAAWLQAHITPTSPAVDSSLTVAGAAADAKVTGDRIRNLETDLNTLDSSLFNQSVSIPRLTGNTYWTFGNEVVAESGANFTTNKGCRTIYIPFSEPLRIDINNPDYNFVVWVYTAQSVASAIYSPTKKYADDTVLIQPLSTPAYFRIGVERKDGTDLTTDYADTTSDAYKIITATKTYTMNGRMCINKIACFGDSIMLGRVGSGSSAAITEYTIPRAIAKRLGCVCDNYAVSGQGYVDRVSVPGAYSAISAVDLTQYNAVVMCYSVDDGYHVLGEWNSADETTIMGQFHKIVNYIYTQNKQIRLIVFAPFNGRNIGTFPDYWYGERKGEYVSRKILSDTLKKACDYYWIPYVEQYDCPINPLNITEALPDGINPSNNYYRLLSDWVAAKVNGLL